VLKEKTYSWRYDPLRDAQFIPIDVATRRALWSEAAVGSRQSSRCPDRLSGEVTLAPSAKSLGQGDPIRDRYRSVSVNVA